MTLQTASRVLVAIKRETTTGVAATAASATQMRIIGSQGLALKRAPVQSQEKRTDGLQTMGRLGYKSVDGNYAAELSVGGATDILLEAVMRSAWVTAAAIPFSSLTTVAITTNALTASGGSWLAAGPNGGIRVGDVFNLSGTTVSADNGKNTIVTAVTTLTLTVPTGTFATLVATATGTMTVLKKVKTATTPTRYSHTIEQNDQDIDISELFLGCRAIGVSLSFKPGEMAKATYSFLGMDRTQLTTGTSPWFTSPSLTTSLGLIADDSSIRYNGNQVATFTGFDLNFEITAKGEPVIGSLVTPDIFDNDCKVSGTITGLRSDFSNLLLYDPETEFDVSILLQEPTGSPPACLSFYLPRVKISDLSAPVGGGDGAKIETLTLMVGPKTAATGYDGTIATISSSAP